MKKLVFGAMALALLGAASCKKSDDNNSSSNTFSVNGMSHTAATVARQAALNGLQAIESATTTSVSQVLISFKTLPTADGTYRVVNSADSANQLDITYQANTTTLYESTGNSVVNAAVTVSGGKIKVVIPDVYLKNFGSTATDSVKFSATLTEQ